MILATKAPAIAVRALARLVASSATFQALVAATGEDAEALEASALEHVYWLSANDRKNSDTGETEHPRPRAIVSELQLTRREVGLATWQTNGTLVLTLEAHEPEEISGGDVEEIRDRDDWWANLYGAVLNEMEANKYAAPHQRLNMTSWQLLGADENHHRQDGVWFDASFECRFF